MISFLKKNSKLLAERVWVFVARARENAAKNVLVNDSFKITNQ